MQSVMVPSIKNLPKPGGLYNPYTNHYKVDFKQANTACVLLTKLNALRHKIDHVISWGMNPQDTCNLTPPIFLQFES